MVVDTLTKTSAETLSSLRVTTEYTTTNIDLNPKFKRATAPHQRPKSVNYHHS